MLFYSWRWWERNSAFWQERKIDMFKDGISVPGLTLKYLFSFLDEQTYFSLFDQANSYLYHVIKDTTQTALQSSSNATTKPVKQKSEKLKKARTLSCARRSWDMTLMRYTSGLLCRICQPEVTYDAWRKTTSNRKVL